MAALQPSIAQAVAEAIRSLGGLRKGSLSSTSSSSTSASSESAGSTEPAGSSDEGVAAGVSNSKSAVLSTGVSAGISAGVSAKESAVLSAGVVPAAVERDLVTTRPEYRFEYKIADDEEQTYISQNEVRDGDDVTGSYSYVDANGDLVVINYQAEVGGFTQTLDRTVGAVQIRVRPVQATLDKTDSSISFTSGNAVNYGSDSSTSSNTDSSAFFSASTNSDNSASTSSDNSASSDSSASTTASISSSNTDTAYSSDNSGTLVSAITSSETGTSVSSVTDNSATGSSPSALDTSALIAQILSVLQPQIAIAVDGAISNI